MRLPNGYGSAVRLNGNRRRPFMARKTIGYKDNGSPIYQIIGYYPSKVDALKALATFNEVAEVTTLVTFASIYNEWIRTHRNEVAHSTISNYQSAFRHCHAIAGMPISSIKHRHLQGILDGIREAGLSYSTAKKVKTLMSLTFKYALLTERISRLPTAALKIGKNNDVRPHKPLTRQCINRIWKSTHPMKHIPLILLYTGMRSIELRELTSKSVILNQRIIRITKSKTKSGIRIIPIHDRVYPIFESLKRKNHEYILGERYSYNKLSAAFKAVMKDVRGSHTTHDCRHTFASLLDSAGANPVSKRKLLGHAGGDVTDKVYTHKSLKDLRKAIRLLR